MASHWQVSRVTSHMAITVSDTVMSISAIAQGRQARAGQVKATETVAFLNEMETSWLLDPSILLTDGFREHTSSPTVPSSTP